MPSKDRSLLSGVAAAGFLIGLYGTALWSAEDLRRDAVRAPLAQLTQLEPIRVLPRTELRLAALEARSLLEAGRPWAAWRLLQGGMEDPERAPAGAVLVAARAAGEWGGWKHARELLRDREWLDRAEDGEGWFVLARAEEELGNPDAAAAAYRRYLASPGARSRGVAAARLGRVLREQGDARGAAAAFAAARSHLPEVEDWMHALQAEQVAVTDDPTVVALAAQGSAGSGPVRLRRVLAEVEGWIAAGDPARALRRLEWEARVLSGQGARAEAARLQLDRARLLREHGREAEARDLLRSTALEGSFPDETQQRAAELLGEMEGRSAAEELARSAAYEAAGKPGLAAKALRAAIASGAPDGDGGLRLRVARLLYAERDYAPARSAFQAAAERLAERERVAEAELYAARALFRSGGRKDRARAMEEIRRVAERYEGTAAAGSALFLLGDEASSVRGALSYYRRAAAVHSAPEAREALYRVGDRSLKLDDTGAAIRAWEEYVGRYPRGEQTARVAYETGRLHERAGRESQARAMYTAAMLADPVSYYAVRASNRLGVDPLDRILSDPHPWVGLAADPVEASNILGRLDALESAGLDAERKEELDAAIRRFEERPAALLVLAEGLRDRKHAVEAIRLGRRLLAKRDGQWDDRLLRVVFPFPYRQLVEEEARRAGVDPTLMAGLIRQESSFRPDARSWVGATGLSQIMPATGRWLAPAVGVRNYDVELLEVPEINVRMGAKYLGDLLDRYDGARDLALAGYNAGPGRADRWRRTLGYGRDLDAFREKIPFDETRHYVKVVLRNAAIYERLYGERREGALVRPDE